jgi:FixJ family two-component response regulator
VKADAAVIPHNLDLGAANFRHCADLLRVFFPAHTLTHYPIHCPQPCSCILLDVLMPGLSGSALQERLSTLGSTLPIIFITGHPDIPITVRTLKAGAADFLTKPVSSDQLFQAIERAIAHHEVTRA